MKQITLITLIFLSFLSYSQTPPARTWYYNSRKVKTTVKERWEENSNGLKHGKYLKYFANGNREIIGYYANGKPTGEWKIDIVQDYGFLGKNIGQTTANFQNGLQHGLMTIHVNNIW